MAPRTLARSLPALFVTLLLAAALLGPTGRVRAERSAPQTDYLYYPICTTIEQGGVGASSLWSMASGAGLVQPIGPTGNVAACSLTTQPFTNATVLFTVTSWDPATLAPPAGSIALRTYTYSTTWQTLNASRNDLYPPLVTRALPNVAEAPPAEIAMKYRVKSTPGTFQALLVSNDASDAPPAFGIAANGVQSALPGAHPVFVHAICGGDEQLQALAIVQSVVSTDGWLDPSTYEYIQKFRLPATTQLGWVELAFDRYVYDGYLGLGFVRIVDAQGQTDPPLNFGTPLAEATFRNWVSGNDEPQWLTHSDFTTAPFLEANHDYWLVVTTDRDYALMGKALTGAEGPAFTSGIGGLYRRYQNGTGAALVPDRALSFRIIGRPENTTAVPAAAPRSAFALTISPNPARGAATVGWTGARGTVRFEVMDARGRRVARGETLAGESGRWSWRAAGDDGAMLPAGLYFVRARDAAGRSASARVTVVR